jgi:hypothetical protein
MHLMSAVVAAFYLCAGAPQAPKPPETLAVHVHLGFDRSISTRPIAALAKAEAAAIWREYGVELQWSGHGAEPALCLDAFVEGRRRREDGGFGGAPLVLAHTMIAPDVVVRAPIQISFEAVEALLDRQHFTNLSERDRGVALTLGRVLAHELGHVLLGSPGYHDPEGLMKARFMADDLVRLDRSRFRLADRSIVRLHERLAALSEGDPFGSCTIPAE